MPPCRLRLDRLTVLTPLILALAAVCADPSQVAHAQQHPVVAIAAAGIDELLNDVDYLFAAGEAPQYAQMVRGVITNFNELRGLDRQKPIGLYAFFPAGGEQDPQPLLFFPVSDVDELLGSVRFGTALRLERGDGDDRLTLFTENGELPVALQHGYAFVDPSKTGSRLNHPLLDPAELFAEALVDRDLAVIIQREGIPPFLFELAIGGIRTEALKEQQQKAGESDEEYAIRRQLQEGVFALLEAVIRDWQGATIGLRISPDDQLAEVDVHVAMDESGETAAFLKGITAEGSQFSTQVAEPAAFSLSVNWQPTQSGRELLEQVVQTFRGQVTNEVADADAESRAAVAGVIDALEATAASGDFDAYFQLVGAPPNGFVLIGATAVAESAKIAAGIERLLPHAAESKDIRSIDMSVARAGDAAIHRMWPQNLRTQDRRLYGDDAAIYLAAGNDALWMAIGGDGALDVLTDAIQAGSPSEPVPPVGAGPLAALRTGAARHPALLDLTVHASDWVGFARTDGGGKQAQVAQIARQAFANPDEDAFHLRLHRTPTGLGLNISLDPGYIRFLGLALAAKLNKQQ